MAARILPAAEERLIQIWDYTLDQWSEAQTDADVQALVESAHKLAEQRRDWRKVPHKSLRGVWFVRFQHHYLFFRELKGGDIGVISILHGNMDIPARLKEDDRQNQEV
jgi:toxin ParE1/3/4